MGLPSAEQIGHEAMGVLTESLVAGIDAYLEVQIFVDSLSNRSVLEAGREALVNTLHFAEAATLATVTGTIAVAGTLAHKIVR